MDKGIDEQAEIGVFGQTGGGRDRLIRRGINFCITLDVGHQQLGFIQKSSCFRN